MKALTLDFLGVKTDEYPVLYHKMGDYSVILEITNCVLKHCADQAEYYRFQNVFSNIIKTLGAGYSVQKHDVFSRKTFNVKQKTDDFLENKYFEHFNGRIYNSITTYFTITKNELKSKFWKFDQKEFATFNKNISKTIQVFTKEGFSPRVIEEKEINDLISRFLCFNFSKKVYSLSNINVTEERIEMGENVLESISLIDIDHVDLPNTISPVKEENINFKEPKDLMSFLHDVPETQTLVYHQVIQIPNQKKERMRLEAKKKKHFSIPDAGNDIAVEDIDNVIRLIEKDNELLVYTHYNILLFGKKDAVFKAKNFVENELFNIGIIPSNNSYNQKELFLSCLPGNSSYLKHYDKFFTTSDPSIAFCYKEALQQNEESHFLLHFADRQGIPISMDPSEKPRATGRINNMNKFLLGPSGTGKSFLVNSMVRQYLNMDTEVVIVDVGHSYSGLCEYYGGRYITYTQDKPITMNPFRFSEKEFNTEKKDFLKGLIGLLWKGSDGHISQVEDSLLLDLITEYYFEAFSTESSIKSTSFNTFYEFSCRRIKEINIESLLGVSVEQYAYVLKQFYKGGEYDAILNSEMDNSLFDEKFIVFEIDNIKDNKKLFPIVTIIIMDVFLQKMRMKKNRKALIIEEAWKAIANRMMAEYIKYVYKTVRKFNGEAMLVTQELDDILGNEIIKNTIISNSDTIILMDQQRFKENYVEVAQLLNLNEVEQRKIFTINNLDNKFDRSLFKETYFKRGNTGEVYGIEEPLECYLTFTTERKEKELLSNYIDACGSYVEGLEAFVSDFKQSEKSLLDFVEQMSSNPILRKIV